MKDATQENNRTKARAVFFRTYIYRPFVFSIQKVRKTRFSENQFFPARGDISEMQQGGFMDWCDLNTEAKKE